MNKTMVDTYIPLAYDVISNEQIGIAKHGKVNKAYRGQISTLGAAITMGSLRSAICFFSSKANNDTDVDRSKLLKAIKGVLDQDPKKGMKYKKKKSLNECMNDTETFPNLREDIVNAAIAIKLAMNLFEWEE